MRKELLLVRLQAVLALTLVVIGDAAGVCLLCGGLFFLAVLGQLFIDGTQELFIAHSTLFSEVRVAFGLSFAGGGVDQGRFWGGVLSAAAVVIHARWGLRRLVIGAQPSVNRTGCRGEQGNDSGNSPELGRFLVLLGLLFCSLGGFLLGLLAGLLCLLGGFLFGLIETIDGVFAVVIEVL